MKRYWIIQAFGVYVIFSCGSPQGRMAYDLDVAMSIVDSFLVRNMSADPGQAMVYVDSLLEIYSGKELSTEAILEVLSVFTTSRHSDAAYEATRRRYEAWVWDEDFSRLDNYAQYRVCSSLYSYYKNKKEYKKAISFVMRGLEALLDDPQRFEWEIGVSYAMIAGSSSLFIPSDYSDVQEIYRKATELFEKRDLHISALFSHSQMAALYVRMRAPDKAREHSRKAMELFEKHLPERENYVWKSVHPTLSYIRWVERDTAGLAATYREGKGLWERGDISDAAFDNYAVLSLDYFRGLGLREVHEQEAARLLEKYKEDASQHFYAGLVYQSKGMGALVAGRRKEAEGMLEASLRHFGQGDDNPSTEEMLESLDALLQISGYEQQATKWYPLKLGIMAKREKAMRENVSELNYWMRKNIAYEESKILEERNIRVKAQKKFMNLLLLYGSSSLVFALFVFMYLKLRAKKSLLHQQANIISEQNEELAEVIHQLEQSNENLKNFASIAAHDIKAPLRTISGFSRILSKKYSDRIPEKDRDLFDFITDACQSLKDIVDGLLRFSSVSKEDIGPPEPVDMAQVAARVAAVLQQDIRQKQARLVVAEDLPTVMGHTHLLEQLLLNLMGNAMKFTAAGTSPEIELFVRGKEGGRVQIAVKDNGIGIAPKNHKAIFDMFRRLNSTDDYKGVGIGLATCGRIVERHGGQIGVESVLGQGATFYFFLPLAQGGREATT